MSTENKNIEAEKELTESDDDGFEVLDPEPEQEAEDFKYLSRNDFTNAGTIIFCHMDDEYNSIQQVTCQYIRPEGWMEQEKDEIAIFEVGWINTEEAEAKIPVDRNISKGYPLGSVDLTEFTFRKEEYAACPGEVSHFQFCYLRDGVLLGASTPFGIRDIKAVSRLSLMAGKPLFLPCGEIAANGGLSSKQSFPQINSLPADNLGMFETSTVNLPPFKHNHDKLYGESEAVREDFSALHGVELPELQSCLRNLTALTRRLQNLKCDDKIQKSECTPERTTKLILQLTQSVDELTTEMQKASKVLPTNVSMTSKASSPESCEDLEQRFRSCAAQLKANVQDCTRTFDLCKVAINGQTPPCSLSDLEKSDYFKGAEWKRQHEFEELEKQLKKAEGEAEKLREELSVKTNERHELSEQLEIAESRNKCFENENEGLVRDVECLKKQLTDKEWELKQVMEELSVMDNDFFETKGKLCGVKFRLWSVTKELAEKESQCDDLTTKLEDAEKIRILTEQKVKSQVEDMSKRMEELTQELLLKEANLRHYNLENMKMKTEAKLSSVSDECSGLRSQITTLQEEAKLYKSKLGETILELANSRKETVDLEEQCKKWVEQVNFLEDNKTRLMGCIDDLKEKVEAKKSDPSEHDVLIQEFLKKSEELLVAKQQVENFQYELSQLNVQRNNLQRELLEARQNPTSCEKPCCTFELDPGVKHTDNVVQSILEALEQSLQENKSLQGELDKEKKRSQTYDEKLQTAAGLQRGLYMEKITLETRLNELLGRD